MRIRKRLACLCGELYVSSPSLTIKPVPCKYWSEESASLSAIVISWLSLAGGPLAQVAGSYQALPSFPPPLT